MSQDYEQKQYFTQLQLQKLELSLNTKNNQFENIIYYISINGYMLIFNLVENIKKIFE